MFIQCFDKDEIISYIKDEIEVSLFIYGDLINYGTENKICRFFFNKKDGVNDSLILQYRNTLFTFYSQKDDFDLTDVFVFLSRQRVSVLSGKESLLKKFKSVYPTSAFEVTYFAKCSFLPSVSLKADPKVIIRELKTGEDFLKEAELELSIKEFSAFSSEKTPEELAGKLKKTVKYGSLFIGAFKGEKLISAASTSADNPLCCMVTAVCTRVGYRGLGYASQVLYKLMEESFKRGKKFLCLFYDNPKAGRIYHKMGFIDIDKYTLIHSK